MSCRSPQICRQAALQTQQHVWITEDILAEAFHRYTRVSLANRRHNEGRRYGSNVPGPLEARRRLAKRRMGVAAVAAVNALPGPDMGTLFGLGFGGNRIPVSPEQGWKWEPPGTSGVRPSEAGKHQSADAWPFHWPVSAQHSKSWEKFLEMPENLEFNPIVHLKESQEAMESLLHTQDGQAAIHEGHLADILQFLQSSSDEPETGNTLRFFQWLAAKEISPDCVPVLARMLAQKVVLDTLAVSEMAKIFTTLNEANKHQHAHLLKACLDQITPGATLVQLCTLTTQLLTHGIPSSVDNRTTGSALDRWLQSLSACKHMQGFHHSNEAWQGVYTALASQYPSPSAVSRHLVSLKKLDLSYVLLQHWVPKITLSEEPGVCQQGLIVTHHSSGRKLSVSTTQTAGTSDLESLKTAFQGLRQQRYDAHGSRTRKYSSLIDLLSVLMDYQVPHVQMAHEIFEILKFSNPREIFGIYRELRSHPNLGVPPEIAGNLVQHFIKSRKPELALKVFDTVPTLSLRHCYDLPLELAKNGTLASSRIFRVLLRKTGEDILPESERSTSTPEMNLRPEQVDLVHLLAHTFATSPHIPDRVAFRRVWECYRFLQDHHAPISSVLTRAIVRTGVIRPLDRWDRISSTKFKWITQLVSDVEGPQTARALDRLVYHVWNREINAKARVHRLRSGTTKDLFVPKRSDLRDVKQRLQNWRRGSQWQRGVAEV